MTQAFNLAQLANNLNTSGQLDATDGLTGLVANANLASSGTASASTFLRGDRTWQALSQKIVKVELLTNSTRAGCPGTTGSSPTDLLTFTYNKISSTSSLAYVMMIPGRGDGSGALMLGVRYGSSGFSPYGYFVFNNYPHMTTAFANGVLNGYTTTGSQTFAFQSYSQSGGAGERPFQVINPSSADDARLNQTFSTLVITEFEP